MKQHECKESTGCLCSTAGLEPNWDCPIHGDGEWPPRCGTCGKFIHRERVEYDENEFETTPPAGGAPDAKGTK